MSVLFISITYVEALADAFVNKNVISLFVNTHLIWILFDIDQLVCCVCDHAELSPDCYYDNNTMLFRTLSFLVHSSENFFMN